MACSDTQVPSLSIIHPSTDDLRNKRVDLGEENNGNGGIKVSEARGGDGSYEDSSDVVRRLNCSGTESSLMDSTSSSTKEKRMRNSSTGQKLGHRKVVNGQTVYKKTSSEALMRGIQMGIRHSVSSITPKEARDLLMIDFEEEEVVDFPSAGSQTATAHSFPDFRFKSTAPRAFRYFREEFGIRPDDYMISLCNEPLRELSNPGASGSLFYLSMDDAFIIKTVQHKEASFLKKLLPGYYMNMTQNQRSLLPKFFGLYTFSSGGRRIRFVVMTNMLPSTIEYVEKYDLKGSMHGRMASQREKQKTSPTLKDVDFLERHPDGFWLDRSFHDGLMRTVRRDLLVLESFRIMDYSLLIGVHRLETGVPKHKKNPILRQGSFHARNLLMEAIDVDTTPSSDLGGVPVRTKNGNQFLLFIGVIDILQQYGTAKKLEHAFKATLYDGDKISVHKPQFYALRFQDFLQKTVFRCAELSIPAQPSLDAPLRQPGIRTGLAPTNSGNLDLLRRRTVSSDSAEHTPNHTPLSARRYHSASASNDAMMRDKSPVLLKVSDDAAKYMRSPKNDTTASRSVKGEAKELTVHKGQSAKKSSSEDHIVENSKSKPPVLQASHSSPVVGPAKEAASSENVVINDKKSKSATRQEEDASSEDDIVDNENSKSESPVLQASHSSPVVGPAKEAASSENVVINDKKSKSATRQEEDASSEDDIVDNNENSESNPSVLQASHSSPVVEPAKEATSSEEKVFINDKKSATRQEEDASSEHKTMEPAIQASNSISVVLEQAKEGVSSEKAVVGNKNSTTSGSAAQQEKDISPIGKTVIHETERLSASLRKTSLELNDILIQTTTEESSDIMAPYALYDSAV